MADQDAKAPEQDKWADLKERTAQFRWKPGQTGNPQGRRLSAVINKRLEQDGVSESLVDAILDKIRSEADVSAFKEIIARHEGHVPTKVEAITENYHYIEEVEHEWGDESP